MDRKDTSAENKQLVFTVSRLSQEAHKLLEGEFGRVWLEGEISNFSKPGSGHFYFSLKDSRAQIRCAMFRNQNRKLNFLPENGQQVLLKGKLSIYQQRGDFQLIADHLEPAGRGLLQQKFEQTTARLREAGWFDETHKQALPRYPLCIGIITSPSGAAVRDILQVLARRYPIADVIIYPTVVQGANSSGSIARAITRADTHAHADVLILARGGGSLEDLWGFNEENVAAALHTCSTPVICGVGHEIDCSIADLVADVRAPTPSAAAELVAPDISEEREHLQRTENLLYQALENRIRPKAAHLKQLDQRLRAQHPQKVLTQQGVRITELDQRLRRALLHRLELQQNLLDGRRQQLQRYSPARQIESQIQQLSAIELRLKIRLRELLAQATSRLSQSSRALDGVSPLATLGRGYALVHDDQNNVITSYKQVEIGDQITTTLKEGGLICEVQGSSQGSKP